MYRLVLVFGLIVTVSTVQSDQTNLDSGHYTEQFVHNFDQINQLARQFSKSVAVPFLDQTIADLNLSDVCRRSLREVVQSPEKEWASLMIDANGRLIRPGFLSGTITDYGDYDQCMSIKHFVDQSLGVISAQYCLLTVRPPLPPPDIRLNYSTTVYQNSWPAKHFSDPKYRFYFRVVSGLCVPAQCHQNEIEQLFQKALRQFNAEVSVGSCQQATDSRLTFDFAQVLSITLLTICLMAVVVGTYVHYWFDLRKTAAKDTPKTVQIWSCFSLIRNSERLFAINDCEHSELSTIHGLRVLLILWVILCHTTNFAPLGLYDQPMIAARFANEIQIVKQFLTQFVISGSLSVQAFFVISGLISLHTSLKNKDHFGKNMSYFKYILLRWLRFAPPLLGMFCYQFLWPLLSTGPIMHWDFLKYGHEPCYQTWYANFLFISNWYPLVEQCGSHTWFLSADFQINLLAYFIILLYVRSHWLGLRVNLVALAVASIAPTIINWYYSVPLVHILEPDMKKMNQAFNMVEFNTYNHFAAYFAGLLVAGLLHAKPPSLSKVVRFNMWCLSLVAILLVPFSTYPFIQWDNIPVNFLTLLYTGAKRFLWIGAVSWIIYASSSCSKRHIVARILSAKVFQPFSRLTFCIYLSQSLVVWFYAYQSRELHYISHYNTLFRVGGVVLYSLLCAFVLYILFEAPSVNLCKLALKGGTTNSISYSLNQTDLNNNDPINITNNQSDITASEIKEEQTELIDKSTADQ